VRALALYSVKDRILLFALLCLNSQGKNKKTEPILFVSILPTVKLHRQISTKTQHNFNQLKFFKIYNINDLKIGESHLMIEYTYQIFEASLCLEKEVMPKKR